MSRKVNLDVLLGTVGALVGAGALAYYYDVYGFRTFLDTITPWRILYINVNPPSPGSTVTEDDIRSASQIVISVIQVGSVTKQTPQQLQDLLDQMAYSAPTRQDLIDLVVNLKTLPCITSQEVCDDAQSNLGAKYIADTAKKIADRFGIPLAPEATA